MPVCPSYQQHLNVLKGHLLWKIHFYMVFEHKCVLAVCEQINHRMIKMNPVFFYNLNKSYALSQNELF